jgi:hypothetical protein
MRMIMNVKLPVEPFNTYVRNGSIGKRISQILEETKPELVYFSEQEGQRGGIIVVNIDDSAKVPFYAEPWFLQFNAEVEFRIAMSPEDLGRAGLDTLGKKWS